MQQVILLAMAVAISAQHFFFVKGHDFSAAFAVSLQRYATSPQRRAVALAVKEIAANLSPLPLDSEYAEWEEKTLRTLVQIVQDNRLGTQ
ncbi:hypothetical protein M408DRAFT_330673 [Serendipita vermifera MAFF 305830]|uniref:Uncharacterized protein n=1 Tax=Serendipita vermifera MAFF 305830 TaxID=933852 RepID=A0A0C3AP05_SERVB|nr:hypothetical protein M408DRAFT_330673 [Serendipita vermifera MAFF 305830]